MVIDVQLLHLVACVTEEWPDYAQAIENFCRDEWNRKGILSHMHTKYICSKEPITTRFYTLDVSNQDLVIQAIKFLGRNLCPMVRNVDLSGEEEILYARMHR